MTMDVMDKHMGGMKEQLQGLLGVARKEFNADAQERLDARRYIVRVIDARDGWTKVVCCRGNVVHLAASKSLAWNFKSLKAAVDMRNRMNKEDHVKSAWIVFE